MNHSASTPAGPEPIAGPASRADDGKTRIESVPACIDADRLSTRLFIAVLIAITLLAGGLRFYHLDRPSFWLDELFTMRSVANLYDGHWSMSKSFGYVATSTALAAQGIDPHALEEERAGQWQAEGVTEFKARLASCLIGIITIPLLALTSRRMIGDRASLLMALLLTLSIWHIQRSQDARFYSQQFLFFALAVTFFYRASVMRSNPRMILAVILSIAAFASQPTALLIVGIYGCDWLLGLIKRKPVFLGWAGYAGAGLLAIGCTAIFFSDISDSPHVINSFVGQQSHSWKSVILGALYMTGVPFVVAALISFVWLLKRANRLGFYLLFAALVPILGIAAMAIFSRVGIRYTFVCTYAWVALAAVGLAQLQMRIRPQVGWLLASTPTLLLIASLTVPLAAYYGSASGYRAPWRDVMAYVQAHRQPNEDINAEFPLIARYYLRSSDPQPLPIDGEAVMDLDRPTWMVVLLRPQIGSSGFSWIDDYATLKKVYMQENIAKPERIGVYYYDPSFSPAMKNPTAVTAAP